jgi:hypothetical protein
MNNAMKIKMTETKSECCEAETKVLDAHDLDWAEVECQQCGSIYFVDAK